MDYLKYRNIIYIIVSILLFPLVFKGVAYADVKLTTDETWEKDRVITGDLIIPDGITLTISSGVSVKFQNEPVDRTSPETRKPHSRILVQGHLEVEGDEKNPVVFSAIGKEGGTTCWAGIVVDEGNAWLRGARIKDAHTAVYVKQGWAKLKKSVIIDNKCGIIVQGESCGVKIEMSSITGNDFGLITGNDAVVSFPESKIQGNSKKDIISGSADMTLPGSCRVSFDKGTVSNVKDNPVQGME